ncbi:transmembrane sensor [Pedobacter africanus]|uniref:Ferric-dicitrate binding protein FerR (Iron transport regulator) n=1 Tax=Pedobacter africanus TaxID=151894 RepID=A0ACC6KVN9_9SPHI|nr:FecR domain-containing protein [Pedobacter africanus]MDR6783217.1 ferric-dicitrate binding protein FerR (iron transport regulator) [Pedobacter africanus]
MDKYQAKELISKYKQGTTTEKERLLIEQWFLADLEESACVPDRKRIDAADRRISAHLQQHIGAAKPAGQPLWLRVAGVAAVVAIAFGIWFYAIRPSAGESATPRNYANDIQPGKHTATLTLANGRTLALSDAKSGVVIDVSNLKYNDGTDVEAVVKEAPLFGKEIMTISTPLGGTYQVALPDGTKIWLNAGSSLKFSAAWKGQPERKVWLSGEGYFEVAKTARHSPFIVVTAKQQVEVLGTHFNISSYTDESDTETTLLEGLVRVSSSRTARRDEVVLKPNQQSILTNNNRITVKTVDTERAVAWKNGLFIFDDEPLHQIMKQIARWYNVEVVYEGVDENKKFGGSISRAGQLSKVLRQLEKTGGVQFEIQERRVIVMK